MKKLMVMMTAAVVGACAWAADFTTSVLSDIQGMATGRTDIVGYNKEGTATITTPDTIVHWWADNWTSSGYEQPATVASNDTLKANFLKIETDAGQPMQRTFSKMTEVTGQAGTYEALPVDIQDHGLFVDTEVQFTGTDTAPTLADDNQNKLLVWLRTIESDDTVDPAVEGSTNLMVTCGYIDSDTGNVTPTNYVLNANVDPAQWYRLTIRADKGQNNVPSFKIYLDGTQLTATVDAATVSQFPSLIKGADKINLTFAGFEGTGNIKDVDLLTQSDGPAFAKDKTFITITNDAGVASVKYGETTIEFTDNVAVFEVPAFDTQLQLDVTFATGKKLKSATCDTGWSISATEPTEGTATITFSAAEFTAHQITIASQDARKGAQLLIGGEPVGGNFPYLKDVVAYVKAQSLAGSAFTVKLLLDETGSDFGDWTGMTDATLDLNGHTIGWDVSAEIPETFLGMITIGANDKLTIVDTSANGGGSITGVVSAVSTEEVWPIYNDQGTVIIENATGTNPMKFWGRIFNNLDEESIMTIKGGKFNPIVELDPGFVTLPTGKTWSDEAGADGYYTIVDAKYTLTVSGGNNAAITVDGTAYTAALQVTNGTYAIVATPNSGYTYEGVSLGEGWTLVDGNATYSAKVESAALEVAAPNAVASAAETYTINITSPITGGTVTTSPSGKAEENAVVTVTATPEEGYSCTAITVVKTASTEAITVTDGKFTMPAEAVTVSATFTLNQYLIRFISGEGTLTTNDYNIAHGGEVTAPTPAEVTGKTFSAWNPAVVSPAVAAAEYVAQYTVNTYTITVAGVLNTTVEVFTNDVATAAWTAAGEYTVPYGTKVVVTYTAAQGYKIEGQDTKSYEVGSVTEAQRIPAQGSDPEPTPISYVAKIGDKGYETLEAAFGEVADGQTIVLQKDYALTQALTTKLSNTAGTGVTFDLGAKTLTMGNFAYDIDDTKLVITNGQITTDPGVLTVKGSSVVTIATNTTVYGEGTYKFELGAATLNVYGRVETYNASSEDGAAAIHAKVDGGVINVYDGAYIKGNMDAIRMNGENVDVTLNVYGGTLEGKCYPAVYVYKSSNYSHINVYGGTFISHDVEGVYSSISVKKDATNVTVAPFGEGCTAKFANIGPSNWDYGLEKYCADGYGLKLGADTYYAVTRQYKVLFVNDDVITTNKVFAGETTTAPADPEKAGHTFDGWYNGDVKFDSAAAVNADATYTAKFTEIKVTSVALDITSTNVAPDAVFTLVATVTPETALDKSITWSTSDSAIATVVDGQVTAVAAGTATITAANTASGCSATCTVTVENPAPSTFTITWTDSENVVVSNGEAQVSGTSGDFAKDTVLKFYATVGTITNVTVNGTAQTAADPFVYTVGEAAATIVVKAGQFAPAPSSGEIKCETEQQATDLAKAITDNPTKYVAAPEGVTGTDATTYAGMFEATASGTTVTLKLTDEATNTLTIAVNESVTNATTAAALVTPTAESATISNATPGMYYWIEGDDDVTHKTFGSAGASVQATSENKTSLELTKPTGFTTKAFYKIAVDFKAPAKKE